MGDLQSSAGEKVFRLRILGPGVPGFSGTWLGLPPMLGDI